MDFPKTLYKYRQYSQQEVNNLSSHSIWVSNPRSFNDPFDCQHVFSIDSSEEELKTLMLEFSSKYLGGESYGFSLNDQHAKVNILVFFDSFIDGLRPTGVYSLSEKKDDLLMWAHYADSYRGYVIGYDCERMRKSSELSNLTKVSYFKDYPKFQARDLVDDIKKCVQLMHTHKGEQWSYENEWRLIYKSGDCCMPSPFPISEVIFGYRMDSTHIKNIRNAVNKENLEAKFYMAKPDRGKYCLEIVHSKQNSKRGSQA